MTIRASLQAFIFTCLIILSACALAKSTPSNLIPDSVITAKIKSKIALDPTISVFKVAVSTNNGVVTLAGTVDSDTDASALVQIASATAGVSDVNTLGLKIKNSTQPFTDTMITAKIKGVYIREKLMGKDVPATSVSVETNNGIVYLSGTVETKEQADNAIKLAKSVKGVKQVESRLKIAASVSG